MSGALVWEVTLPISWGSYLSRTSLSLSPGWVSWSRLPLTTEAPVAYCLLRLKAVPVHLKQISHVNRHW